MLFLACATYAQESQSLPTREAALAAIKKWRTFDGTWEGELTYVAAPKQEWFKESQPFKVTFGSNGPKAFVRTNVRDWLELGSTYQVHQPDELTIVIHAYGAAGVWTENNVIVLTRRSENDADVFIQRVVNNWAGTARPGEDRVYGDSRRGKASRK